MSNVLTPSPAVNVHSTATQPTLSALWAALGKVAGKESSRDHLAPNSRQQFALNVSGTVDGTPVSQSVTGVLTVGRDVEKSSSRNPAPAHVLAVVLSKLNEATRAKVLAELPVAFSRYATTGRNDDLPQVEELVLHQADQVLAELRSTRRTTAKGAVKCSYVIAHPVDSQPPFSVVG